MTMVPVARKLYCKLLIQAPLAESSTNPAQLFFCILKTAGQKCLDAKINTSVQVKRKIHFR